jgi:hypothetical protein
MNMLVKTTALASATPALVVTASAAAVVPEPSELLLLEEQIERALGEAVAARDAHLEALRVAEWLAPKVPADLIVHPGDPFRRYGEELKTIDDKYLTEPQPLLSVDAAKCVAVATSLYHLVVVENRRVQMPTFIVKAKHLREHRLDYAYRSAPARRLRRLLRIADRYERQRKDAITVARLRQAADDRYCAVGKLGRLSRELTKIDCNTPRRTRLIARAIAGLQSTADHEDCYYYFKMLPGELGQALAAAVLHQAPAAAA